MTYNNKQLINARIDAADIAERLVVAYWMEEQNRPHHIREAIKSFEKLADTLGYNLVKKDDEVDLIPDSIRLA